MKKVKELLNNALLTLAADVKKLRIPVSRGRYERELALVKTAVSRGLEHERQELQSFISKLHYCYLTRSPNDQTHVLRMEVRITDYLLESFMPSDYERLLREISTRTMLQLKRELRVRTPYHFES